MVIIRKLELKQRYRYVWLKYVSGFNLSQHCAKCLTGTYEKRINNTDQSFADLELPPSPYYYFCTVNKYATNIHLAFVEAEGESVVIEDNRYNIAIENARQIHFDNSRIDATLPGAQLKAFNTCRNWWFANWIINAPDKTDNLIIYKPEEGEPEKSINEFRKQNPDCNSAVIALPEKDK